ncbi:MAG TPA: hypothetical protein VG142_17195 [Trebonia sp.]|nr:hypothetical protein [Trebonia sp.]
MLPGSVIAEAEIRSWTLFAWTLFAWTVAAYTVGCGALSWWNQRRRSVPAE